jgi:hypothetical protein
MAGVLQFTLGLEASQFLNTVGLGKGKILSLAGAAEGLHKVFEGLSRTIERGAGLEHLSKRTGETVANLFMLEKGFAAAGVGAEQVGPMLFMMQKSLGGINEMGESTADIFSRLGLSLADLRTKGGAAQVQSILGALSKLNQEGAAKAASGIFGRQGAATAVQLSRSIGEMTAGMARAAPMAYVFDRMAAAFAAIQRSVERVKQIFEPMWLGIAQYAVGPIQDILAKLEKIDLSGLGQKIGQVIGLIWESFGNGTFSKTLALAFQVGFEKAEFYAMKLVASLGAGLAVVVPIALKGAFNTSAHLAGGLFGSLIAKLDLALQKTNLRDMETSKGFSGKYGSPKWTAAEEQALAVQRQTVAVAEATVTGTGALTEQQLMAPIKKALAEMQVALPRAQAAVSATWKAKAGPKSPAEIELQNLLAGFAERLKSQFPPTKPGAKKGDALELGLASHRTEGNVFEKMGFVSGGANGPVQETARNTARTADNVRQLRDAILEQNTRFATNDLMNDAG